MKKTYDIPVRVVKKIGRGKILKTYYGGGVGSALHIKKTNNEEVIIKISTSDGLNNGRRKLIREAKQIMYLRKKYPELNEFLPEVVSMMEASNWAAVEYPFYKGESFAHLV